MRKKRVGVDVDGVLSDFTSPCLKIASEINGRVMTEADITSWDLDSLVPPDLVKEMWSRMAHMGCRDFQVLPGALEGMERLKEIADIYIVTAHMSGSKTWSHDREEWLMEHFKIPSHKVVHTKAKYIFTGEYLIDDKPQNIDEWAKEHTDKNPILWLQCYNLNHSFDDSINHRVKRINNWDDLIEHIK